MSSPRGQPAGLNRCLPYSTPRWPLSTEVLSCPTIGRVNVMRPEARRSPCGDTGSWCFRDRSRLCSADAHCAAQHIHGNREALDACLAHARSMRAERFVFLGDYVGYGADPSYVVDTVV